MARESPRVGAKRVGAGCCGFLRGGQPPPCPVPALAPGGGGLVPWAGGGDLTGVTVAVWDSGRGGGFPATGFPKEGLSPSPLPSPGRQGPSFSLGQGELLFQATTSGVLQLPALLPLVLQHRLSCRHLIPATNLSLGRAQLIQAVTCCCNPLSPSFPSAG